MEDLVMFADAFRDKTVWLTGHTGFKGAWLAEWLLSLGANVHGYALAPTTKPALFEQLGLAPRLDHQLADLRDATAVRAAVERVRPDFVFHLAAQPLVRESYQDPVGTYATNVMGTVHVLEALGCMGKPCAAVFVTTDKCYENREWLYGYRETDPLGGFDPYSSSKAAAELAIASYRCSFFREHPVRIASARAGNVIGGGDWATDRIVPDCIRALQGGQTVPVRNRSSTRPWQHVLEPLSGYLWLAASLAKDPAPMLASAFNFGPAHESNRTVGALVEEILRHWPGRWEDRSDPTAVHEASLLQLSIDKAHSLLDWSPVWRFSTAVEETVRWYREPSEWRTMTTTQIARFAAAARTANLAWARS